MHVTENPSTNPFLMVRSTIEAEISAPGILTVSSALARDGKTGVAGGIVRSLAAAGYKTLAIDAGASAPHAISVDAAATMLAESARRLDAGCDFIALAPQHARTASAASIETFFTEIRARYDYAVVDAAVVHAGGLAFARAADGVVLALREGRAVNEADRDTVELFGRLHVRFLGVVATRDEHKHDGNESLSLYERLQPRPLRAPVMSGDEQQARPAAFGRAV